MTASTRPTAPLQAHARHTHARPRPRQALAGLALACLAVVAHAAPLDDMRRQVESSQFDQAYLTAQANPQLIGDVHFDFLFGVAAINVGRVAEGVLALERHLTAVPANDRARLEMARGYFLLGDFPRARLEFEFVLRYNQPAGVRANIDSFLQAMQARETSDTRASARLYVEASAGYDSNVNGGTYNESYQVGALSLAPDPGSRQVGDSFGQVALGGQHTMRVSSRLSVFVGGDADLRQHRERQPFDLSNLSLYLGFSQLSRVAQWRTTLTAGQMVVGDNRYRDNLQVGTEATFTFSQDRSLLLFGNFAQWSHAAADGNRDANVTTLGAMFSQSLPSLWGSPTLGARLTYVQEDNQRLRKDFSKKGPSLRAFVAVTPFDKLRVSMGLTGGVETYGGPDFFFESQGATNAVREDKSVTADLNANYALDARWSLRLEGSWKRLESNQDLYDNDRKSLALKLRYQF